ncbi:MAG: HAD family phosphatase [Liquorilactobacillus ghanensis]|jgi:HAD superfamily hydrolase (TIGR01509 family)|uniref:HAD superfamily hydrolase n=1 Tax=Liquorilactobacillus ghanensis DSM 18630 TaxID=1423750 RepID=A0A0R1VXV8_9LACO|nr:HAD family phosphatase [Liquorilactobacillus ghanensis]KRM07897.1 HAD superfamily hydrolase [Liquorilactobacillus ghanensis DSM 18630]
MNLKLMIFDMDGLVFDSEKVYFQSNLFAAKKLGMDFDLEYYRQYIGAGNGQMLRQMSLDYGSRSLIEKFITLSHDHVQQEVAAHGLPLKKGFLELNHFLRKNKIKQVLASSNDREAIDFFLERSHMQGVFDEITSGDDVANAKPAPDIFEKAWRQAGAPSKQASLVLEDSVNGILAANQAEIPGIMVPDLIKPTPKIAAKAAAVLPDLAAVRDFIQD